MTERIETFENTYTVIMQPCGSPPAMVRFTVHEIVAWPGGPDQRNAYLKREWGDSGDLTEDPHEAAAMLEGSIKWDGDCQCSGDFHWGHADEANKLIIQAIERNSKG